MNSARNVIIGTKQVFMKEFLNSAEKGPAAVFLYFIACSLLFDIQLIVNVRFYGIGCD